MKLLIIEDEEELAKSILAYFRSEDYLCELANDFEHAKEKINNYSYDCIVLDINLPGGSGLQLLEIIKGLKKNEGVIIVSAKNSLDDRINGLKLGADDYLSKPFHLSELNARVQSVIRRKKFDGANKIQENEVTIDLELKAVFVKGFPLTITKTEYDLLVFLIANKKKVVSKNAMAEHLSGDDADMFNNYDFVYAHIKNLKKNYPKLVVTII
jgi:DNA-binding response OmpR family regulator